MRFRILLIVTLLVLLSSCQSSKNRKKMLLLTTIHPYELLLSQLVGDEFEVQSIIPANASPHTWSPKPTDLRSLIDASLILSNGLGLEKNLEKSFATRKNDMLVVAKLIEDSIPTLDEEEHHHEGEEEHHHEGTDPHLWTSPQLMIKLVSALEKELSQRFPNSSLVFSKNAETMRKELEAVVESVSMERNEYTDAGLVTYHNSFGYFSQEFGIDYLGWVQFSPGQDPSPTELASLGETIKERKVKALFVEPQMDKKSGEVLAKEFGLQLLTLDPLGSDGNAKTISQLILNNWNSMKGAFVPK